MPQRSAVLWLLALLLVLATPAPQALAGLGDEIGVNLERLSRWRGNPLAGDLAFLLAGIWLGRRGVIGVLIWSMLLHLVSAAASEQRMLPLLPEMLLDGVVSAVAFGVCGARIRQALGTPLAVPRSLHLKYMALVTLAIFSLVPEEKLKENPAWSLLAMVGCFAALIVGGIALRILWQRRRASGRTTVESEYEGWLAVAALIAAATAVHEHLDVIREQIERLRSLAGPVPGLMAEGESSAERIVAAATAATFLASGLWAVFSTLAEAAEKLRGGGRDLRRAASRVAKFFGLQRLAEKLFVPPEPAKKEAEKKPGAFQVWTKRIGRAFAVASIVGLLVLARGFLPFNEDFNFGDESVTANTSEPTPPPPNPHLVRAAREFAAAHALTLQPDDFDGDRLWLCSEWSREAKVRSRYRFSIRPDLDSGLEVSHEIEEAHGLFWYADIDRLGEHERQLATAARTAILQRARELAGAAGG